MLLFRSSPPVGRQETIAIFRADIRANRRDATFAPLRDPTEADVSRSRGENLGNVDVVDSDGYNTTEPEVAVTLAICFASVYRGMSRYNPDIGRLGQGSSKTSSINARIVV